MKCKFCMEEIAEGAIKCKHCGSMLNTDESSGDGTNPTKERKSRISKIVKWTIIFFIAMFIIGSYQNHIKKKNLINNLQGKSNHSNTKSKNTNKSTSSDDILKERLKSYYICEYAFSPEPPLKGFTNWEDNKALDAYYRYLPNGIVIVRSERAKVAYLCTYDQDVVTIEFTSKFRVINSALGKFSYYDTIKQKKILISKIYTPEVEKMIDKTIRDAK